MDDRGSEKILGSLFLEMLGSDTPLALQHSVQANSLVERCLQETMQQLDIPYRTGAFRSIIGNDEIVWEAHDISMPSLSRFPYPEYHTSDDNPDIISRERLKESITLLERSIDRLESQRVIKKQFSGVPATGHPRYDLYVDTWGSSDETARGLRKVMDYLPIAPDYLPVPALKERFDVPDKALMDYLQQWEEKGLIELL
jgi:aminopeptidase-like protein